MKYYLHQLNHNTPIQRLTVLAHEMSLYLVQLSIDGEEGILCGDDDRPMRFFNAVSIREAFAGFQVEQAYMHHDTPYEEMVGIPPKACEPLILPFSLRLPY